MFQLQVYYLDNLACDAAVRSLDVPRSKFFTKDVIDSISKADKVALTYGKLPVSTSRRQLFFF